MRTPSSLLTALALSVPLAVAGVAEAAPIPECGGIDFQTGVSCEVKTSGGCTAACTPVNFEAQCSVTLQGGCDAMCQAMADVSCTGQCNPNCTAQCMANANFDCNASCNSQCGGDCTGQCASSANQTQCTATCKATCSSKCNASCMGTASGDCTAKCSGCCTGQCRARANFGCEINCTPPMAYANCESKLQGGCQVQCSDPKGALFCNGQYVDTSSASLDKCLQTLLAQYNIKASGYAYGSCMNGTCTGNAGGSVSCAVSTPGAGDYAFGALGAMSAMGLGLAFMQRRRSRSAAKQS